MTNLIQTHSAPDLLVIDTQADNQLVLRVGGKAVPIRNIGRRAGDPLTEVVVSVADLRALAKESYCRGWEGKCIHIESLRSQETKRIGG